MTLTFYGRPIALCNRADLPRLSQRPHIGCLPYFDTWCGLSANLECRSEICCTRLAENTGRKKVAKIAIWAPSHNFVGRYLRKAHIDNRKKNLLSSSTSCRCPHTMVNFGTLAAEIVSLVWGTPANFNRFRVLPSLLQQRRSREANQTVHDVWLSILGSYIIGTFSRALVP